MLAILLAVMQVAASPITVQAAAPDCSAPSYRAFDMWVGSWTVTGTGKDQKQADSIVESLHGGCVIRERWIPVSGAGGSSLSALSRDDQRWHQRWINSTGTIVDFDGGPVGGKMVLTGWWPGIGGPGKDALVRMTYSPNPDGTVRQFGEASQDHGVSWKPAFDLTYHPKKSAD